jgi:hypothetical protein
MEHDGSLSCSQEPAIGLYSPTVQNLGLSPKGWTQVEEVWEQDTEEIFGCMR